MCLRFRLVEVQQNLVGVEESRQELQAQVEQVQEGNQALKREYDALLERRQGAEHSFMEEKAKGSQLLEEMIHMKKQAAARMNTCNERKSRYLKYTKYLKLHKTPEIHRTYKIALYHQNSELPQLPLDPSFQFSL